MFPQFWHLPAEHLFWIFSQCLNICLSAIKYLIIYLKTFFFPNLPFFSVTIFFVSEVPNLNINLDFTVMSCKKMDISYLFIAKSLSANLFFPLPLLSI